MSITLSKQELQLQLHQACTLMDLEQVKQLLVAGADINQMAGPTADMDYPLTIAVRTQSISFVQSVLDCAATPQISAIKAAAATGNTPILNLLLKPIKSLLTDPERSTSHLTWKTGLAGALREALIHGQPDTAEVLMVWKDRITAHQPSTFEDYVAQGFTAAATRGDDQAMAVYLDWASMTCSDVLIILATHKRFEFLHNLLTQRQYHQSVLDKLLPVVAEVGHLPTLKFLIDAGSQDTGTALRSAVQHSQHQVFEILLDQYQYTTRDLTGALRKAAELGDLPMILALHESGAECGRCLVTAAEHCKYEALLDLLERFPHTPACLSAALVEATSAWGRAHDKKGVCSACGDKRTPLDRSHRCLDHAFRDKFDISEFNTGQEMMCMLALVDAGAALPDDVYLQTLELLVILGNEDGAQQLLTDGAGSDRLSRYTTLKRLPDTYLLSLAIYHSRSAELIQMLLMTPVADAWQTDQTYPPPVMTAIWRFDNNLCKQLLEAFPHDVHTWVHYLPKKNRLGHYSRSTSPHYRSLRHAFGPDPIHANALSAAMKANFPSVIKPLLDKHADPWSSTPDISTLELAAKAGLLRHLMFWNDEDARLYVNEVETVSHRTILHWAANYEHAHYKDPGLLADLIKQGADLEAVDHRSNTPLHLAVGAANLDAVKTLCWAGASLERECVGPGEHKATVLELAVLLAERDGARRPRRQRRLGEKREGVVRFLRKWSEGGVSGDAEVVRRAWDEDRRVKEGHIERVGVDMDVMSEVGDEESLHLSDDDDNDDGNNEDEREEKGQGEGQDGDTEHDVWELIDENPEEL